MFNFDYYIFNCLQYNRLYIVYRYKSGAKEQKPKKIFSNIAEILIYIFTKLVERLNNKIIVL